MTTLPEPPASEEELAEEMRRATKAMERVLAGLVQGSELELESLQEAFRGVQRVGEVRRHQELQQRGLREAEYGRCEAEYRAALADWNRHLPRLHGWLLAERSRLGSRSGHAHLVRAWLEADRQTR